MVGVSLGAVKLAFVKMIVELASNQFLGVAFIFNYNVGWIEFAKYG